MERFFLIIYNLYQGIKSCISFNGNQSSFFQSFRGVWQGENLSPVLFALFLKWIFSLNQKLFWYWSRVYFWCCKYVHSTFYIFILLYADDTVIFGTDETKFWNNFLNAFYEYSNIWRLDINYDKTNKNIILIFGTHNDDHFDFRMGENKIQICKEFKYLGAVFTKSRNFNKTKKHIKWLGNLEGNMHLLYKRIRNLNLPVDL